MIVRFQIKKRSDQGGPALVWLEYGSNYSEFDAAIQKRFFDSGYCFFGSPQPTRLFQDFLAEFRSVVSPIPVTNIALQVELQSLKMCLVKIKAIKSVAIVFIILVERHIGSPPRVSNRQIISFPKICQ